MNKPIQQQQSKPALFDLVKKMGPQLSLALPKHVSPDRMLRITLTALSKTPKLAQCSPESFLGAMMSSAQLGLEPNTPLGMAYLIPYWNGKKGCNECQFQIGYKGMLDIAYRSKEFKNIYAKVVDENDDFSYELGLTPDLKHKPAMKKAGKAKAYYAVYHTISGGVNFEVMSYDEVEEHMKKYSKSYKNGPWKDHFDEMAKKTVLKKLLKTAPQSIELAQASANDSGVITVDPSAIENNIPLLDSSTIEFNSEGTAETEKKEEAKEQINDLLGKK